MTTRLLAAVTVATLLCAGDAQAAKHCAEPGERWQRATPAEVGMDAAKVKAAVQHASARGTSSAVRVYRHGCLIAEDALNPERVSLPWQSFSLAKSVVSLAFGRAWTMGLISPDDPVGALFSEADETHGALLMRHVLTMTAGLSLVSLHDLNIAMADRVRDALTLSFVAKPGETWAYWQSGPALAAAAVGRAAGDDFQAFAQRELFGPLGIRRGSWLWTRDLVGNTAGFWGLFMSADNFARLGELLRREGVWHGRRLLSKRYVHDAVQPTKPFGCYAWFIWRQSTKRCNWPAYLGLPEDMWQFNGASGQVVTVFPTQGVMVARTGVDASQGGDWVPGAGGDGGVVERELYERVLRAITDAPVDVSRKPRDASLPTARQQQRFDDASADQLAAVLASVAQPALPPAGPWRARAVHVDDAPVRADRSGRFWVVLRCPPLWRVGDGHCRGSLNASRLRAGAEFDVAQGEEGNVRLRLTSRALRVARRNRRVLVTLTATARDGTPAGTSVLQPLEVRR